MKSESTETSGKLIKAKKIELAIPHMDQILSDIEKYKLEEWDPDLALKSFKTVLKGFRGHSSSDFKDLSKKILNKIAKIDAVEAIKISK